MATLNFDASQITPDSGVQDPIPKGWYNVVIDETEMKPTSKGDGHFLNVRHNIVDGQYAGRKVYARINVRNPNPQAQEIGYKQLSAICHAVGIIQVADSSQLHNIPLKIRVKIRKDDTGQYDDQNDITAWKNINEQVPMGSASPAAAPTFAPPAQQFAPPTQQQVPAQFAPPPQQVPQQTPPQQWTPPATAQPWQQAPQQQAPQAHQQQFAPPPQATQPDQQAPAQQPQGQQTPPWAGAQQATPPWQQPQQ